MSVLPFYAGSGVLLAAVVGATLYAPLKTPRAGWFGIPFGTAVGFFIMIQFAGLDFSGSEIVELAIAAAVAGVAGWRLPWPDSAAALVVGPAIGALLVFLLGGGPDNPVPFLIAGCTLVFTGAALASALVSLAQRRRTRIAGHG